MAEDKFSLHIDSDWKKQAQEEKQRLAEEEAKRAEERKAVAAPVGIVGGGGATATVGGPVGKGKSAGAREMPSASLGTLVQSTMTQVLYYLGDLAPRGSEPQVNLDLAKHHIDTLSMLEEKTKGNLTDEEKVALDAALYETRMRFVSVGSQYMGP